MRDADASVIILQQLHEMGVRIAIDDFGTGYSSLLYLKRLPASELKIDRGFVRNLAHDSEDRAIVSAIVALGQTLDLKIVAEGRRDGRPAGVPHRYGLRLAARLPVRKADAAGAVSRGVDPSRGAVPDDRTGRVDAVVGDGVRLPEAVWRGLVVRALGWGTRARTTSPRHTRSSNHFELEDPESTTRRTVKFPLTRWPYLLRR